MIGALAAHHLRWLARARHVLATALLTAAVVGLAGALALHDAGERTLAAAALVWLTVALGGLIATARVLAHEEGQGGLEGLLLSPVPRRDLYLARTLGALPLVLLIAAAAWLAAALLFPDLASLRTPAPLPALLLGALGLTVVGTLAGWAALSSTAGELLGPVLALPLAAPLLIACLHATEQALTGGFAWGPSLTFAAGYDLAVGALAYLISEHVVEVA